MEPINVVAVFALLVVAGWTLLRIVVQHCRRQIREGILERTRLLRELHDTLLQNFQGVLLKFHAAAAQVPHDPGLARARLEEALAQADQTITEGRDAMQALFATAASVNGLRDDLIRLAAELGADPADEDAPSFRLHAQGDARELQPIVRDEVHRIAREAVRNAFRHARADRIEVAIYYGARRFELRVADDGKGISPSVLAAGGRPAHSGIPAMRDHARLAGGRLSIASAPDSGTEITLGIPAARAYVDTRSGPFG